MSALQYTWIRSVNELDAQSGLFETVWRLHNQLRPQFLTDCAKYPDYLRLMVSENQQVLLAFDGNQQLVGLAMFNMHHNTYQGKILFLEDLVIEESLRGTGVGEQVLQECERLAKQEGCSHLSLDSGVFRGRAHKFYFVHDYIADCFHFSKAL